MNRSRAQRGNRSTRKPSFNCDNEYLSFTISDALFRPNFNRLKDQDFKNALTKITKDINLLLYMN